jgi:hypothetical protein
VSAKVAPVQETPETWDTQEAAKLACEAYTYTARTFPPDAPAEDFEDLGAADAAVVEAQSRGDWSAYVEALRALMRVAKRERLLLERERAGAA